MPFARPKNRGWFLRNNELSEQVSFYPNCHSHDMSKSWVQYRTIREEIKWCTAKSLPCQSSYQKDESWWHREGNEDADQPSIKLRNMSSSFKLSNYMATWHIMHGKMWKKLCNVYMFDHVQQTPISNLLLHCRLLLHLFIIRVWCMITIFLYW